MSYLSDKVIRDAQLHAREQFPKESCGLVVNGAYVPCENIARDPLVDFEIDPRVYAKHARKTTAVLHSHPNGPLFPTEMDMVGQLRTNKVWGIIALDDERIGDPVLWGGDLPIPAVIGREFMHGVTDCYALLRDMFRLGRDELAKQDLHDWPFPPIELPDYPRKDGWWLGDDDFYEIEPPKLGFVEVPFEQVRPGDVFLTKIRSNKFNHAGMLVGGGLIVHHLPQRLSRREGASIWGRQAERWIRYQGPIDA